MIYIDGPFFLKMVQGSSAFLSYERKLVDALNVFPVPDGDTGTNMTLTIQSAVRGAKACESDNILDIAEAFSRGALRGARGNSGVILSQICRGFALAFKDKDEINSKVLAEALTKGTEIAYSAVTKPKEGTILTVVRVMAETAYAATKRKNVELEEFFETVVTAGENILAKTPEMLPVLKHANVVDAGGRGLLALFKGMQCVINDTPLPEGEAEEVAKPADSSESAHTSEPVDAEFEDDHDYDDIKFAYCTEFFITHLNKTVTEVDIDKLRDRLLKIGDCVLVIGDIQFVKVHVHTNNPDKALAAALALGELDGLKIENMLEQHRKIIAEKEKAKEEEVAPEKKDNALIAVCAGEGFSAIFKDFCVDKVVEGGQTMNPSVHDFLRAINDVNANNVFIFPNNSNIILAANQAKELADTNVIVIPTTNVPQGIAAVLSYMPDSTPEENEKSMCGAITRVKCGQVTHAVRNARMNGFSVKEGDIIGFSDKSIVAKGADVGNVVLDTIAKFADVDKDDAISLYYGEGVSEEDATTLSSVVQEKYPDMEVMTYAGGQPHYYYVISIE